MEKEIFDFPVKRVPTYAIVGEANIQTERDCIVRLDTNKIIGYVSAETVQRVNTKGEVKEKKRDYYQVVTHTNLVTEARHAIKELGIKPTEKTYMLHNGGRLYHQFDFPTEVISPVPGDFISMRLNLVNSYDLSRPCGWELGGLRLVCTNGLVAFRKSFFEMKKHAGGFSMDNTINSLKSAIITFKGDMRDFYTKLAETPITVDDGKAVITDMMEKNQLPTKYGEIIESVWENPEEANSVIPEMDAYGKVIPNSYVTVMDNVELDYARNLWTLYNAFTLILTHYVVSIEVRMLLHDRIQKRVNKLLNGG